MAHKSKFGFWPVMLTPFKEDNSIDWGGVDRLVDWYLENGAAGLFAVCLSSEMYDLSEAERLDLARAVLKHVDSRVEVVATGTFDRNLERQIDSIKKMSDTGVDAVICIANQMAEEDDGEDALKRHTEQLLARTGDISLGFYECPVPYKRVLSPGFLAWAAQSDRFVWYKETSESIDIIRTKLNAIAGTRLRLFNAHTASLLESLLDGVAGGTPIAGNFYPFLISWLCDNFQKYPETAQELQRFLTASQEFVDHKYVASAKKFLALSGFGNGTTCRISKQSFSEPEIQALRELNKRADEWRDKLKIIMGEGS